MAGAGQDAENPLGVRGGTLHEWIFATQTGREMIGQPGGEEGVDDDFFKQGFKGIGATIMGRNMFGPVRGPWGEGDWRGWWGDDPPFHHPVFVLTHHAREPIALAGGTTFHFVTDGIDAALALAVDAAQGADVRVGGGAATIRQFLRAGLIDSMHVAVPPVLLGGGERLFPDEPIGYACERVVASERATHYLLCRSF
jgi:dihydrofolate reductase